MNTPNERLKYLRKDILHLTQANMANSLSMDGSTFGKYEKGSIQLKDRVIINICREFNVNEEWLRNGTGEIFIKQPTELIDQLCKQYNLDSLARQFLETFVTLSDGEATLVYTFVDAFITNNPLNQKNT